MPVGAHGGAPAVALDVIVGRDAELTALNEFLAAAEAGPRALLLEGQAGIGKTTLWQAAVGLARERGYDTVVCRPSGAEARLSYAALGDLLEPVRERTLPELPDPQRAALEVALLLVAPGETATDQRAVATAFLSSLRQLQRSSPLLVAIDDVQWLDRPTVAVLEFALRRLESERIAILLSRRSEGVQPLPLGLDRGFPADRVRRLSIGPLSVGALHRLLHLRIGVALPRPTLLRVHEASDGNPFYALETVRMIQRRTDPIGYGQPLPTPDSMTALVRERLGSLPANVQRVLRAATVPSDPTVAVVATLVGRGPVRRSLEGAVEAGLIELENGHIRFAHPLLASAVYSQTTSAERRRLHRRLSGIVEDPEERARHLALAAEGPDQDIAEALDEAAQHAGGRGAPAAAAELLELAVRLTPSGQEAKVWRRRTDEARYLRISADFTGVRSILERLCEDMPAGRDRAEALLLLGQTRSDDFEVADRLCRQALQEAHGDDRLVGEIELFLGGLAVVRGDLTLALARTRSASEAADRAGDQALLVACLASVALYETFIGEATPGILERAEHLERNLDRPPMVSPGGVRARRLMYAERLDEARESFAESYRKVSARGNEYDRARSLYCLALVELRAGRWERAAQQAAEGCQIMEQAGGQDKSALLYPKSLAHAYLGRVEEARATAEEGVALSHAAKDEIYWIANQSVLGFLALSLGDAAAAARHLGALPGRLAAMGYGEPNIYPLLPDAVEALIGIRELATARELLEQLEELAVRLDNPWALATSLRCRGVLMAVEGDLPGSLANLERALVTHEWMQQPFERARTLLALGQTQRRSKQRRAARGSLEAAATTFKELGAVLWLEKASAELRRIGGRPPPSSGLTASEERVAALVAEGKTNREVAAALYVSVRTVEGHLSRIYPKLGVRSRAELASRLAAASTQGA